MKQLSRTISVLSMLALWIGACGGPDLMASGDVCQDAAQHTAACLGESTPAGAVTCDAAAAQELLELNCDQIVLGAEGKADWFTDLLGFFTWGEDDNEGEETINCNEDYPVRLRCAVIYENGTKAAYLGVVLWGLRKVITSTDTDGMFEVCVRDALFRISITSKKYYQEFKRRPEELEDECVIKLAWNKGD